MPEQLSSKLEELLKTAQGKEVSLDQLRAELRIEPGTKPWHSIRVLMHNLAERKVVKPSGRKDGIYKVIQQIKPIRVFGRERRPPVRLNFPTARDTGLELSFAEDIIFREGDMVLLSGQSNYGKTALCLNFCGENLDMWPNLMGNEYTSVEDEPMPRFLNRLDSMDWVEWIDDEGQERFTLLPVRADYAEHIIKDRLNIIDWVNLPGEYYMISPVMEAIKHESGRGITIIALQKNPGVEYGRGGNLTKDFADCELLLDKFGEGGEVLLTIGKVKEYRRPVTGRTFAYQVADGVKVMNFREVVKCLPCRGTGFTRSGQCEACDGKGKTNKDF